MSPDDPVIPDNAKKLAEVLKSIAGKPPANPHLDNGSWDFLTRADARLREKYVRPVLHDLLIDPDEVVREHAIGSLMQLPPKTATFDRLVDIAKTHRKLLTAKVNGRALAGRLQHALSNLAVDASERRRAARSIRALTSDQLPVVGGLVAQFEPDHVIGLARKFPGREDEPRFWNEVADRIAVYQRDHLLPLLQALAPLPVGTKQEVLRVVTEALKVDDSAAAAFAAADGLAGPSRPGPSVDDCATALGL